MKSLVKSLLRRACGNAVLWPVLRPCIAAAKILASLRAEVLIQRAWTALSTPARVQAGPFAGMIYPESSAHGSAMISKLLGTYEAEIASHVSALLGNKTKCVVDVGAAEGYYAVGFAMRCPEAQVFAYDTASEARRLCGQLAAANEVSTRVHLRSLCSKSDLLALSDNEGTVVIVDCEGGEVGLIDAEVAAHLSRAHFLIECHDHLVPGAFDRMSDALKATHSLEVVSSIPDSQKALEYRSPLVPTNEPIEVLGHVFGEGRAVIMKWIIATPCR